MAVVVLTNGAQTATAACYFNINSARTPRATCYFNINGAEIPTVAFRLWYIIKISLRA
jgi:hypothetical protein